MPQSLLKEVTSTLVSDWKTGIESLASTARALNENLSGSADAFAASTTLMAWMHSHIAEMNTTTEVSGENANVNEYMADYIPALEDMIANGDEVVFSGYNESVTIRPIGSDGLIAARLYDAEGEQVDSIDICTINSTSHTISLAPTLSQWTIDPFNKILTVIRQGMEGRGLTQFFADACQFLADAFAQKANVSAMFVSWANAYASVPYDVITGLSKEALRGPQSVVNWIQQYISDLKSKLQNTDEKAVDMALPTRQSLSYSTFSCGMVLRSIGNIFTTVGIALVGVSRIASAIVSLVGTVLTVVGRITDNVAQQIEGVSFTHNRNGDHAFDFAIDKGTFSNTNFANILRTYENNGLAVLHKPSATVWYFYLVYPNNLTSYEIGYEFHLSTDFDVSDFVSIQNTHVFLNGNVKNSPCGVISHPTLSTELCFTPTLLGKPGTIDSVLGTPVSLVFDAKAMNIGSFSNWDTVFSSAYKPCDVTLFKEFENLIDNCLNLASAVRLASACLLFGWWVAHAHIIDYATNDFTGAFDTATGVTMIAPRKNKIDGVSDPSYWTTIATNDLEYGAVALFAYGFNTLVGLQSSSTASIVASDWTFSASRIESLLTLISKCFDGLISNRAHPATINDCTGSFAFPTDETMLAYGGNYIMLKYDEYADRLDHLYNLTQWSDYITTANSSNAWPSSWMVELPSVTWSAFVSGLIVDGLVALAIVAIAVGTAVGYTKLKNYRARLQARTEAKWYTYGDLCADPSSSKEDLNAAWKDYKTSRLSYNLLAMGTGGTKLSLGLYDDADSSSSILTNLVSWVKGGEDVQDEDLTIRGLVQSLEERAPVNTHTIDDIYDVIVGVNS